MARFLSFALLPARAAQECLGIRASILLADAIHISGDWADKYVGDANDIFETGQRFSSLIDAFGMRASWLKTNRGFRAVMLAMGDPVECLKQLRRCKLWDERGRADRVSTITRYGPPGMRRSSKDTQQRHCCARELSAAIGEVCVQRSPSE
jgi:hypothetical protein